ncbi:recombinase family protein [Sphingobium yanoikuyae]|jgi:DNA invertase Pin-like site-specific DNA recombinase|uniref:recombinase family protein n=1 Tax=Sphingobium yanoikuyae TaxID=13690 RepID=UPI0028AD4022|nr:recombinase family protein [Sphingobium yanoikuyae]
MLVGYARVSTTDQDLTVQLERLSQAGCEKVFSEKQSGSTADRDELQRCIEFVREGDVLLVTRLDRLARSVLDLHVMLSALSGKGVGFRCIDQAGVDTTTSHGKLMLGILGSVAEFETDLRRERQREGIAKAKAQGAYKGGKARIDAQRVNEMLSDGANPSAVARALGISRQSVYRLMS